jgi:hypothetical protein
MKTGKGQGLRLNILSQTMSHELLASELEALGEEDKRQLIRELASLRAEEEHNQSVLRTLLDIESQNSRDRQGADLIYGDKRSAFATERLVTEEEAGARKPLTQRALHTAISPSEGSEEINNFD